MTKPTFLEDLVIDEVSLVDAPANKSARVILMKNSTDHTTEDDTMTENEIKKLLDQHPVLKNQADAGQVRKVAANLVLDKRAAQIQTAKGGTYANAYVAAMDELPEIAEIAVGNVVEE